MMDNLGVGGLLAIMAVGTLCIAIILWVVYEITKKAPTYDCAVDEHNYQHVYDTKTTPMVNAQIANNRNVEEDLEDIIRASSEETRTYVKTICVICGHTINRDE